MTRWLFLAVPLMIGNVTAAPAPPAKIPPAPVGVLDVTEMWAGYAGGVIGPTYRWEIGKDGTFYGPDGAGRWHKDGGVLVITTKSHVYRLSKMEYSWRVSRGAVGGLPGDDDTYWVSFTKATP